MREKLHNDRQPIIIILFILFFVVTISFISYNISSALTQVDNWSNAPTQLYKFPAVHYDDNRTMELRFSEFDNQYPPHWPQEFKKLSNFNVSNEGSIISHLGGNNISTVLFTTSASISNVIDLFELNNLARAHNWKIVASESKATLFSFIQYDVVDNQGNIQISFLFTQEIKDRSFYLVSLTVYST